LETVIPDSDLSQPDFLLQTMHVFAHPSTILWRAIEARELHQEFLNRKFRRPVLDLGCGDGRFSRTAFNDSTIDVGVDIVRSSLSKAKKHGSYQYLLAGDGSRLPFRDGSFETIISNSVLEHIPNLGQTIQEIRRVLKDGGFLVFTVPSANFSRYLLPSTVQKLGFLTPFIQWYGTKRNSLLQHFNVFTASNWTSQLTKQGFALVQVRSCLTKDTIRLWDAMALVIFTFRVALRKFPNSTSGILLNASQKWRIVVLSSVLRKFYLAEAEEGGDLIVVARK